MASNKEGGGREPVARLFLTRREAAGACGVGYDLISREIHAGRLRAKRTSVVGKDLMRVVDLEAWFDALDDA